MAINVQNVERFKFIAHKIIPLVYDDSLSYYEFLCKVMQKLNEVISSLDNQNEILEAFDEEIIDWETRTDNKYNQFVSNINSLFEAFKQSEVVARTAFMDALIGSYNASTHYAVGQYVRYGNNVYKCTTATSGEAWNPTHWTQVIYADDLSQRQSDYEERITTQQNNFETEITGQQTTFEQSITEQQNDFESSMQAQWDDFFELYLQTLNIVQGTGDSETAVMSQRAVTEIFNSISYTAPETAKNIVPNTWTNGYYWFNGEAIENVAYAYSEEIDVEVGDIITCIYTVNSSRALMRFIEATNGSEIVDSVTTEVTEYTVPDGATKLRFSVYSEGIDEKVIYIERGVDKRYLLPERDNFVFSQKLSALSANTQIKLCDHVDNKKNYSYLFTGFFDSFSMLEIGHGTTEYGAVYLRITNTDIQTIAYNGTVYQTFEHGLTLSDFITVNIKGGEDVGARAEITIRTNGGGYSTTNVIFFGCNGAVYAVSETAMTDVVFDYVVADMKKDIFVFGDSYTSLADNMKFPYYLLERGYTDYLLAGFGGATANDGLLAFNEICDKQKPKYIVWLLGMNNPDNGAINASWLSCTETVIAYCETHKIVPILATIPNTPNMENTYKNEWVRNSGHRYVDFAKAVGAEASGSAWYTGMLSSDYVHPSIEGAKVLAERILVDVPEIAK